MRPVSAAFNAVIRQSGHTRVSRVALLNPDLSVGLVLTGDGGVVESGGVTADADRRRRCQFTLANPGGAWTPATFADALFPNRLVRLDRGVMVGNEPEYVSLGVFVIDTPRIVVTKEGSTIRVSGQDRVKLALKSKWAKPQRVLAGTPLATVVQGALQDAGMGVTLYRLNDGGKALAADRVFDTGLERWPTLQSLVRDYALLLYVDADGYATLEPAMTPDTVPDPVWTFERGAEAIMLGLEKELSDERWYNHTLAGGEGSDFAPVAAEARDLNPDSPGYNPLDGTGPIGDRLYTYTSPLIRSVEQAQAVADVLLLEHGLVEESIDLPSVVHPALEVGDVVEIVETLSRTSDWYILDSVAIPLGVGESMTLTSRKVRSLIAP